MSSTEQFCVAIYLSAAGIGLGLGLALRAVAEVVSLPAKALR